MIRPGNELLTDRHRPAARWLPTTVQEHPQNFDLSKILAKSSKIWTKSLNI